MPIRSIFFCIFRVVDKLAPR